MRKSISFLRDYLGAMDIPSDEDGLVRFVLNTFETKLAHYQGLLDQYAQNRYPEKEQVTTARDLAQDILSQRKDNVALLNRMVQKSRTICWTPPRTWRVWSCSSRASAPSLTRRSSR